MSDWDPLKAELEAWSAADKRVAFWWRDDDACRNTVALQRLLALSEAHACPLALAAIPALLEASLPKALAEARGAVVVLQHGFAHENHAAAGAKKVELCANPGAGRDIRTVAEELSRGGRLLAEAFSDTPGVDRLCVLVPPWNRLEENLVPRLPELGFRGLSSFGPCPTAQAVPGLVQVNCHLDIFSWKPERRFLGETVLVGQLVEQLRQRRRAGSPMPEPLGLLTHHLVHDEDCWCFLDRLFSILRAESAVQFPSPRSLFAEGKFGRSAAPTEAAAKKRSRRG